LRLPDFAGHNDQLSNSRTKIAGDPERNRQRDIPNLRSHANMLRDAAALKISLVNQATRCAI
jgi:hypothetical protein